MTYSRISGTGSYLPEKVLTNADLEKIVDTTDEWIRERTGILKRHIVAENQATSDLAEIAARNAMQAAGKEAGDIDLIVVATTTPDKIFPSTACLLQRRLGIHGCAAFDVQARDRDLLFLNEIGLDPGIIYSIENYPRPPSNLEVFDFSDPANPIQAFSAI